MNQDFDFKTWHKERNAKFAKLDTAGKIAHLQKCLESGNYPEKAKIAEQIKRLEKQCQ